MSSVQFRNLSTSFSDNRDSDYPRVFQNVDLRVTDKKLGLVASLSAVKIDRDKCRGCFLDTLDGHSEDLLYLSVELFDDYGRIHPWLIEPGSRSGTGCWNKELNSGQLVFIMTMSVIEKYRGQGIGSFTLKEFVTSKYVNKGYDTVMCWPTPESNRVTEWKQVKEKQVAFFRKNGFRRVGRTGILAFSPVEAHPSRSIPIGLDANEKGEEFENVDKGLPIHEIRKKYPVHTAIFDRDMNVAGTIRNHYQLNPASIHQPNSFGYTPIHLALVTAHLEAVRVLLELGVIEDLNNSNNVECRTPLEALESVMLSSRHKYGGHWKGYNVDELTCEFLVKRAMNKPTMADTLDAYIAKRKWGCTCGACTEGWLSNGMRSELSKVIIEALEFSEIELDTFRPRAPHCNPKGLSLIRDFPQARLGSVTLTFYLGCQAIFEAVNKFLCESEEPLSVVVISARTSNDNAVKPFFKKGGRIEDVLDSITQWAMFRTREDETEFDDECMEILDSVLKKNGLDGLEGPCANDLEFRLVRQRLGLGDLFLLPDGSDSDADDF